MVTPTYQNKECEASATEGWCRESITSHLICPPILLLPPLHSQSVHGLAWMYVSRALMSTIF